MDRCAHAFSLIGMDRPMTLPDLSLAQIRCFLTIVDTGSFVEAGRRLGLSAPVVSRTIARIEAAHGVKLFHRSTHAVSLTGEGQTMLAPARAAAEAMEAVVKTLEQRGGDQTGLVRVTATVALMRQCLVPLLPALHAEHPELRLDLRTSNLRLDLADHGIDVALRTGALDGVPGHVARPWFSCPWVVCASPGYLAERSPPPSPDALVGHRLIGFRATDDGMLRSWRFRYPASGAAVRILPDPVLVFDDGEAGWRAVLDGLGVACAPLFLAASALRAGAVVELLREWRDEDLPVAILRRQTRFTSPRVEQLIAFLRRHVPDLETS